MRDDETCEKYKQIWNVIKNKLGIKFQEEKYEEKYLKAKVKEFDGVIKANFKSNGIPKENMHYTCIACVTIDSVMKIDKNSYPQVYLKQCKYRVKKIQMFRFIRTELDSESDSKSNSDAETKSDT